MRAHEIFQSLRPTFGQELLSYFRKSEKEIYKTTIASLAVQRKLRPVFVQRKPGDAQVAWLLSTLKLRSTDTIGEHLLQVWLLKTQSAMLIRFLNDLGIEHDGEGAVENLPDTISDEKLKPAVDGLLAEYPAEAVTVYLHVFQMQTEEGWSNLADLLANDPRLTFAEATA